MTKEFIPYEQALALKELGFDEPCFGYYDNTGKLFFNTNGQPVGKDWVWEGNQIVPTDMVLAPTFSQVFRFFREKHGYFTSPTEYDDDIIKKYDWHITKNLGDGRLLIEFVGYHNRYEEAELACLIKLIEIVKTK